MLKGMGGVTGQDMLSKVSHENTVPASHKQQVLPDLVELPLVIVNGTFRCLDRVEGDELEDFLRYLCNYTAGKEGRSKYQKPAWWHDDLLPFNTQFAQGSKLVFFKDKARRMRHLVKTVYRYYSCKELVELSTKFAQMHVLSLLFKSCSDGSIAVMNKTFGNVLIRIPASNMEYDYGRLKKTAPVLRDIKLIEVITLDEEEEAKHNINSIKEKEQSILEPQKNKLALQIRQRLDIFRNEVIEPVELKPLVDTIVLSDSDDDRDQKVPIIKKDLLPSTFKDINNTSHKSKIRRLHGTPITPSKKKKLRLYDKLNNLQKAGSVSFYSCITITDDEEDVEEDDDCQIVSVTPKHKGFGPTDILPAIEKAFTFTDNVPNVSVPCIRSFDEDSVPSSVTAPPPSQDEFLSNFGLIHKEKMNKVEAFIKSNKIRKKLRRLKLPLYHMPLELLPLLVARGVINPSYLEYNPASNNQERKINRKTRKPAIIKYSLPPGVYLKECFVRLKRLPFNSFVNGVYKIKKL